MRVVQEPDVVSPRAIVIVAALGTLVTAAGVWGAWQLQKQTERSLGVSASESIVARWGHPPEEQNGVEMSLFGSRSGPIREAKEHAPAPPSRAHGAEQRLHAYGWSDRARGTVHIPIDRALLLYVARAENAPHQAPAGGPGGSAP